ncbi:MAG: bifunctional DNA-formamidopyrimidine glycosylase/DNA-(apurinic or apyrimidinic site) lyase [Prosthecobacter sp.]|jgi:formamidopyrimidine-DNA glycosylase|uniref:bifunctional DNA-formamidopyrimidine glycosylase/DNA-(apurinic or apyrimidinic site) lyase n=1 Tax=Prosthecobacter sp. TaxID=1965333 RepID=UPI0019EB8481|nr:bifunctional DNA-formamidopyrimidine glycosylase/DNA-(apurinic or apyrimidinic site) lyase [Prosthecobacter sp.]MBE2286827.1 bifunctional DNA-formamidopyrimidine glycosylase/DNA-(apurinic or apyrimidinic site) lyase [Prosthecobacter sp.]
MPELPEVETTLRGVSPHLIGKRVREVIVRDKRLRWPVPDTIHELEGCRIDSGVRRAKYMLFGTAKGTLLLHLGMSGNLRILPPDTPWRKHDHLALTLDSGKQLRLHDPRRFGAALWIQGNPAEHALLRELGPEPLGDDFTTAQLHTACQGKTAAIKQVIMDAHVVVGVGNIYASEALFMAGIDPRKPAGKVTRPRLEKLVAAIREVLAASIEMGGTTLRDFLNESGEPGYFAQTLRVYDREGEPCRVCGARIRRIVQGQRSTFYCPKCQR